MDIIGINLFIIGIFLGSFFDCIANRLSRGESIIKPGSHCENCKHKLSWYELIPVFSFIFQGGRCKKCKIKLPFEYILVEILTGLLFSLSYIRYGITYETLEMIIISSLVIVTIISDLKYIVILDEVLIPSGILLLIIRFLNVGLHDTLFSLLYGVILFIVLLFIKVVGDKAFKRESLGWGDVKLSLVVGFSLGIELGLLYIFLSSLLALPYAIYTNVKNKDGMIPFGPFMSLSFLVIFAYKDFFMSLFNMWLGV